MLKSLREYGDYTVSCIDGDLGDITDYYFDDIRWTIRYLLVDTFGFWDQPCQVLVSPIAVMNRDSIAHRFHLSLTQDRVQGSPRVDWSRPVSRSYDRDYHRYNDFPAYWGSSKNWGSSEYPSALAVGHWRERPDADGSSPDAHLQSVRAISGYHVAGTEGEIGRVRDLVIDDRTWNVRYLVIDASSWWPDRSFLLAPHWIEAVSWNEAVICADLPRRTVRTSPEWHLGDPIARDYETRLQHHYGALLDSEYKPMRQRTRSLRHVA